MVFRLIYRSQAVEGLTDTDLRSIAMFSAIKNKQLDISGLLLHFDGHIMQVLEGPKDAVQALYARIEKDPRHTDVKCVYEQECNAPAFETWSMGFRPVECVEDLDVFFTLSKESLDEIVANANAPVRETIQDYASNAGLAE